MDPDRQKRKKEISKSLKFIQWEAFCCCCCCCYLKAPMKMKPTNVPEWLTSLITRLSDDFSKHVYILSSRSSLAYPEPEGYQVPVVITSTVLCLSPLLNCCCFLFCFPLQPPLRMLSLDIPLVIPGCMLNQRLGTIFTYFAHFLPDWCGVNVIIHSVHVPKWSLCLV